MTLLQSITLALSIIGSISGLIALYISLSNFFNKRPKIVESYRIKGLKNDQIIYIKIICIENTRIDSIHLKDLVTKNQFKIFPDSEKSKMFYPAGEHNLEILVHPTFIDGHKYVLLARTNYDKILMNYKFLRRKLMVTSKLEIKTSASANLSVS